MPQMSPMNWLVLMLFFYMIFMISFSKIHFFMKIKPTVNKQENNFFFKKMKFMI